jgi:hypothetical protein
MVVWHIRLLMASAAVARLSDSSDRQLFLISTIPAVVYFYCLAKSATDS